jgi:hypothetical protein
MTHIATLAKFALSVLCLFFVLLGHVSANAQTQPKDLLSPIHDVGLLAPPDPPGPGGPKFYNWTGATPNWEIAQWNLPESQLSPFKRIESGRMTIFFSTSPEATVKIIKSSQITEVALAQNGTVLPCETASGIPRESDLLLGPNGDHPNPPGVPGLAMLGATNLSLSKMNSLTFEADISIIEGNTKTHKGCKVSQGGALLGIVLSDFVANRPQTMFYQLAFDRLCGVQPAAREAMCLSVPSSPEVFSRVPPYGTSDFAPLLGIPLMHSGDSREVNVDILPRLKLVIETGPPGIDHNISHWVIGGLYVGQNIWGDVTMKSNWKNIHLLVLAK